MDDIRDEIQNFHNQRKLNILKGFVEVEDILEKAKKKWNIGDTREMNGKKYELQPAKSGTGRLSWIVVKETKEKEDVKKSVSTKDRIKTTLKDSGVKARITENKLERYVKVTVDDGVDFKVKRVLRDFTLRNVEWNKDRTKVSLSYNSRSYEN